jgi:hypothetical protein
MEITAQLFGDMLAIVQKMVDGQVMPAQSETYSAGSHHVLLENTQTEYMQNFQIT